MSEAGDGIKSKRKTPACVEVGNDSDSVLPPNVLGALKIICTFGIGMEGTPVASRALATVSVVSILMGLLMSYGCKLDKVNAQAFDNYLGRRVYLQSIVVDLASPRDEGGYAATIRVRSAAPLRSAGPRVSESIQSVTERKAHGTSTKPAVRYASGGPPGSPDTAPIAPTRGIHAGQEVVFESVYLWDYQQLRPFCDVELENGQYVYREMTEAYFFRQHSNRCRMASVIDVAFATDGIGDEFSITKPDISINWEDIRRNKGAMAIKGAMLPFPGPSLFKLEQKLENGGAELLNAAEICDPRGLELLSIGIQSEYPDDAGTPDYFDGRAGRRVAGLVRVCPLEDAFRSASVGLPETIVFAQGNADFEIAVRPIVQTLVPENVSNRATVHVLDGGGANLGSFIVPLEGDADYDSGNPNVAKFNVDMGSAPYEPKTIGTELDSARFQLQVEVEHIITVKRPVYQPIDFYAQLLVTHITYCGCSKSGGSCNNGTCSCSCSTNRGYAEFEYYPDHYRVDETARQYEPTDPSSDVTYTFSQTFFFEPSTATFDKTYEELIYVEPTPRPGRSDPPDYYPEGQVIGRIGTFQSGTEIVCGPGVETVAGEPTSWTWIPPGVNSKDEEYGGCRPNFVCRLDVPPQEEIFGPGGLPTEEDYECLDYDHDSE